MYIAVESEGCLIMIKLFHKYVQTVYAFFWGAISSFLKKIYVIQLETN